MCWFWSSTTPDDMLCKFTLINRILARSAIHGLHERRGVSGRPPNPSSFNRRHRIQVLKKVTTTSTLSQILNTCGGVKMLINYTAAEHFYWGHPFVTSTAAGNSATSDQLTGLRMRLLQIGNSHEYTSHRRGETIYPSILEIIVTISGSGTGTYPVCDTKTAPAGPKPKLMKGDVKAKAASSLSKFM